MPSAAGYSGWNNNVTGNIRAAMQLYDSAVEAKYEGLEEVSWYAPDHAAYKEALMRIEVVIAGAQADIEYWRSVRSQLISLSVALDTVPIVDCDKSASNDQSMMPSDNGPSLEDLQNAIRFQPKQQTASLSAGAQYAGQGDFDGSEVTNEVNENIRRVIRRQSRLAFPYPEFEDKSGGYGPEEASRADAPKPGQKQKQLRTGASANGKPSATNQVKKAKSQPAMKSGPVKHAGIQKQKEKVPSALEKKQRRTRKRPKVP